jgi:hypothetical protein
MRIIFPSEPFKATQVDVMYEREAVAARAAGFSVELINHEQVVDGAAEKAVRRIFAADKTEVAIYRGWMLTIEQYRNVYEALSEKNIQLINNPTRYRHCHYFPDSYHIIEERTPKSVIVPMEVVFDIDHLITVLAPFDGKPVVVKDYVKSRKHEWETACFIPNTSDHQGVNRIITCFLELQGEDLQGGLVFRQFVDFEEIGEHPKSKMPLTLEYRIFVLNHRQVAAYPYWGEAADKYRSAPPPECLFSDIISHVDSRFFTMDVAKGKDGTWMIIELGDGQVAGLPECADQAGFYQSLKKGIKQI